MTRKQQGLVWKTVICLGFAVFFFAYVDAPWMRWLLLALLPIAAILDGRPKGPPDIEGWVRAHPFVKIWLAVCTLAIAGVAVATVNSIVRFDELLGHGGVFSLLLIAVAPLVAVGVWETYQQYGKDSDAT